MKIRTVLLVLWTLMLLVVLLSPIRDSIISNRGGFQHWDKVAHFGLFAVTGFISVYGAGFFSQFVARVLFGLIFGLVLAFGTELGQYLVPFRDPDFYDLLADLAGLFFGLLSYTILFCFDTLRSRLRL
jgi:VanZ family protein